MPSKTWTVGGVQFSTNNDLWWDLWMTRTIPKSVPPVTVPVGVHILFPSHYVYDPSKLLLKSSTNDPELIFVYLSREEIWKTCVVKFSGEGSVSVFREVPLPYDLRFTVDITRTSYYAETLDDYKSDWVAAATSYLIPNPTPTLYVTYILRFYEPPVQYKRNKFVIVAHLIPLDETLEVKTVIITDPLNTLIDFPMWCWYPVVPTPNGLLLPISKSSEITTQGTFNLVTVSEVDPSDEYRMCFISVGANGAGTIRIYTFDFQYLPYIFVPYRYFVGVQSDELPLIPTRLRGRFRVFDHNNASFATVSNEIVETAFDIDRMSFGFLDGNYGYWGDVRSLYYQSGTFRPAPDYLFSYVQTGYPYFVSRVGSFMKGTTVTNRQLIIPMTLHPYISEGFVQQIFSPGGVLINYRRFPPIWGAGDDDILSIIFGKGIGVITPSSPIPHDKSNYITPLIVNPSGADNPIYLPLAPLLPLRPYEAILWMDRIFPVRVGHPHFLPGADGYFPIVVIGTNDYYEGEIGVFKFKRFGNIPYKVEDISAQPQTDGSIVVSFSPPPTGDKTVFFIVEQYLSPEFLKSYGKVEAVISHSLVNTRDWEMDPDGSGNWVPFSGSVRKRSYDHPPKRIRVKIQPPTTSGFIRIVTVPI